MKTKGLKSVFGAVNMISQFVVYLRAIIAAIEAVKDVLKNQNDQENED